MAAEPAARRATYQDVIDAPANLVAEIIEGRLYTHPRPGGPEARAKSVLGMDLGTPFDRGKRGPGGWIILYEPELHLGADVMVPDLAGWRRETMAEVPSKAHFKIRPDWVCEVLSPSTALLDRRRKLPIYLREQVGHVWLVDPRAKSVEVFRVDGASYRVVTVAGEDDVVALEPFEAVELELAGLWIDGAE